MKNPLDDFGCLVFDDRAMRERLPRETYTALQRTIREGKSIDPSIAGIVANAMKDWAIEKGVTHYTHWFQPMTGITAEKHDSFLSPYADGDIIMKFSGKELIQGEPDASSFPSGGLRATFEARGYTAWDPTSYAFIKEGTLCIPTAFCSYDGQALDMKTPLLRSMESINRQALRVLRLLGDTETERVITTTGAEQEYFLLDKEMYKKRRDLVFCGRTLFGAKPAKGQELEDHYFGAIRPRVQAFMRELNHELWKLGVLAKTEHNETSPSQHELAPIFTTTNIAVDHNQLTMEMMKKVAEKHDLVCLLHEKPFAWVNGSGKHNNWSLATDQGENLLDPGDNPAENMRFLLFLAAIIAAVDEYQDLLRIAAASAGNDHRLGASEAPPAIISIYLGSELTSVLEAMECGSACHPSVREMQSLANTLPAFAKDTTDRNRTSPFAFTGNKFEFRMPGSSASVATPNIIINTIVAEKLSYFADCLEQEEDVAKALPRLICETVKDHQRILFNGNNYSEEWVQEAARRGLLNLETTVDALPYFTAPKNISLFEKQQVFSEDEVRSRYEILLENYKKTLHIEALTMLEMAKTQIFPATSDFAGRLAENIAKKRAVCQAACKAEEKLVLRLSNLTDKLAEKIANLEAALAQVNAEETNVLSLAKAYRDKVKAAMKELRAIADEIEPLVAKEAWPFPTYSDLLFSV
ncbi:MAG TPA: glutamine synthetase type III [Clostridiales bacterium]|jgi:glutamine synthetase|nr:glutamine synthetase type III [Clostridiales bacterium]